MDSVSTFQIIHLSTFDALGGAAKAAMRLHRGLLSMGEDSRMKVRFCEGDTPGTEALSNFKGAFHRLARQIRLRAVYRPWEQRLRKLRHDSEAHLHPFSWYGPEISAATAEASVVHIHWASGFFDWPSILKWRHRPPLVITLHDLHPITGGCVYPQGCTNFINGCGNCHHLLTPSLRDQSARILDVKLKALLSYGADKITLVATTPWMLELARKSKIGNKLRCEHIPLGIDLSVFATANREQARFGLGIKTGVPVIIGVAHSLETKRKGWDIFANVVNELSLRHPDLLVITVGDSKSPVPISANHRHYNFIKSEKELAQCYAAADVMLAPSREEAFGQTIIESMASGTPVITSDTWGPSTIVEDRKTGYLATTGNLASFLKTTEMAISNQAFLGKLGTNARRTARFNYSEKTYVETHLGLYRSLQPSIKPPARRLHNPFPTTAEI